MSVETPYVLIHKNMTMPCNALKELSNWRLWAPPAAMAVILFGVSEFSFLAFHTMIELVAIIISFVMFSIAWSTRHFTKNNFLLFLACGFFWIGSLDLMHTLVYKGMNVFVEGSGNLSVQFWLSARYSQALLLLAAPFVATRKQNGVFLITAFGAIAVGLTTLIFLEKFPTGFVEGTGLTDFKIYSEYLIDLILLAALIVMCRKDMRISTKERVLISASIVLTMIAELAFTFYVDVFGLSNLVGHIFKLFSFWLIFQAIVISNLMKPYSDLQESEQLKKTIIETVPDLMWLKDLEGRYLACNTTFECFFGAKEAEIIGKSDFDLVSADLAQFFRDHDKMAMLADHPLTNEEWVTCADNGNKVLLETVKTSLKNSNGSVIGVLGIGRDITKRKQTEAALSSSENQVKKERDLAQNYLDVSLVLYASLGDKGTITAINPKGCDLLGYKEQELLNKNWVEMLVPQNIQSEVLGVYEKLMAGDIKPVEYYENVLVVKSGEERLFSFHNVPIYEAPSNEEERTITGILFAAEDITDRRQAESALR